MKNIKNEQQVMFQIKGIELIDVKLSHPQQPLPAQTIFHFNINLEQKVNPKNKLVIVVTSIEIIPEDNETCLGSIKTNCIFEIANFDDFISEGTGLLDLPNNVLELLNSISISTIRGVMFSQFRGTFLHNAVLPIIDPKSFVKNNI